MIDELMTPKSLKNISTQAHNHQAPKHPSTQAHKHPST